MFYIEFWKKDDRKANTKTLIEKWIEKRHLNDVKRNMSITDDTGVMESFLFTERRDMGGGNTETEE